MNPEDLQERIRKKTDKLFSQVQGNGANQPVVLKEEEADVNAPLGRLQGPTQTELETRKVVEKGIVGSKHAPGRIN